MCTPFSDTLAGYILRLLGGGKYLRFADERSEFDIQQAAYRWRKVGSSGQVLYDLEVTAEAAESSRSNALRPSNPANESSGAEGDTDTGMTADVEKAPREEEGHAITVVDWYGTDDPANPVNWPAWKKFMVYLTINYCSMTVYMAATIYTVSQTQIKEEFDVSTLVAASGVGFFIIGYGIGPVFWSPLSEIPSIGRNIPYVLGMTLFMIISIPTALTKNMGGLLFLRFLQGLFGSPILSTGGASLTDIADLYSKPYSLFTWAISSLAGPSLGTIIAGFTTPVMGWRWSLWLIPIVNAPGLLLFVRSTPNTPYLQLVICTNPRQLILPESSATTILYHRARRIRALTGQATYRSKSEIKTSNSSLTSRLYASLTVPWRINALDPSILFTSLYMGLLYAIFYSFFEFFPLVYGKVYGMNPGQVGLMFLTVVISITIAGVPYALYIHFVINKSLRSGKTLTPEDRLLPALVASLLIPVGLFIFAWTSRSSIHFMVPTIGVGLVTGGTILILQCIFVYITLGYPQFAASLFSGNGFAKAMVAFCGVLWSHPMYEGLGVAYGMTLMGALCAVCVVGMGVLYYFGHFLRSRSRFSA